GPQDRVEHARRIGGRTEGGEDAGTATMLGHGQETVAGGIVRAKRPNGTAILAQPGCDIARRRRRRAMRKDRVSIPVRISQPPRASSAATAGRVLPSRNSRNAPPPVEMYDTLSAMPYLSTAASVSPPPAMENAAESAIALARVRVPLPKASNSNTPTGPFQTTVPALPISPA